MTHEIGMTYICATGHRIFVPYKCSAKNPNICEDCKESRSRLIISKLFRKLEFSHFDEKSKIYMWTLGTNIDYTFEYNWDSEKYQDNLGEIIRPWQLFNTRMKVLRKRIPKLVDYRPIFYVVEAGSTGNKLHIHFLMYGYLEYRLVKNIWSRITGIPKPNVNYISDLKNVGYIAKYTGKGALTYRFLGELYKVKLPKHNTSCKKCSTSFSKEEQVISLEEYNRLLQLEDEYKNPIELGIEL